MSDTKALPKLPPDNEMHMSIEKDGTVTIVTGAFAEEVHVQADEAIQMIEQQLGSVRQTQELANKPRHVHLPGGHQHQHPHVHGGHGHGH